MTVVSLLDFLQPTVLVQSVSRVGLCSPTGRSAPGVPVLRYLLDFAQTHVHCAGDATQPPRSLSPPSPPTLNLSQQQGLFR